MCITILTTTLTILRKRIQSGKDFLVDNFVSLPLEGFLAGCAGGVAGRGCIMIMPEHLLSPMGQMVSTTGKGNATILYRFAPYWGLRLAIYSNSVPHFANTHKDTHPLLMTPYFALTGAWTELWMRAITNPFNKIRYSRDLAKRSTVGQLQHIWQKQGGIGFFNDTFKYRAEIPKMAVLFGTYHPLRNTILQLTSGEPAKAPLALKAVVDFVCGGAAGAASAAIAHGIRTSVYESDSIFVKRTKAQMIKTEAPVAAVTMCLYGVLMHFIQDDDMIDGGMSGWKPDVEFQTEYGGHKSRSLSLIDNI